MIYDLSLKNLYDLSLKNLYDLSLKNIYDLSLKNIYDLLFIIYYRGFASLPVATGKLIPFVFVSRLYIHLLRR